MVALLGLGLLLALLAAACGNGSGGNSGAASPTPKAGATATSPGGWGPAPRLGGNITKVSPAHQESVTAAQTVAARLDQPGGICFTVNFTGLENPSLQWFQFALDGVNLTAPTNEQGEFTWFQQGDGAIGCFAPAKPLAPGRHTAAASVQNPQSQTEAPKQVIGWQFDVTP